MKHQSWHLDRRELLKGGGVAIALPLLNGMGKAMGAISNAAGESGMPKRMFVSYFAYGAYMPDGTSGVPAPKTNAPKQEHHPWSWWPCKAAGPLIFNKSASPFAPLKDDISYLRDSTTPAAGNSAATAPATSLPPAPT